MGIFDSDYKARGSVSANQIGLQRSEGDSYYGELLLLHPYNGRNFTDELIHDIKDGVTATFRRYRRRANLNNFKTYVSISNNNAGSVFLDVVKETIPMAIGIEGSWGPINGMQQALVAVSNSALKYRLSKTAGEIATVKILFDDLSVIKEYKGPNGNLFFDLYDWWNGQAKNNYDTGISASNADIVGYFGIVSEKGLSALDIKVRYYYMSQDQRFNVQFEAKDPLDAYACISLQDNGNNENPYYQLGKNHPEYIRRERTLGELGIDFEEMSKAIFDPKPIPAFGSQEWTTDYGLTYQSSDELKAEYATERIYHDSLVQDQGQMKQGIKNITDVHFGMFLSPAKLDIANAYALKGFFKEILPYLPKPKSIAPMGTNTYGGMSFNIQSGSLKIAHTIGGYKFGRVVGSIADYKPAGVTMHIKHKSRISWGIVEKTTQEEIDDEYGDINWGAMSGTGAFYIATVSADYNGQPTYEFIEIYKPYAVHHIDVLHDGNQGTSQVVDIRGGLVGYKNEDYSDVLLYPLTVQSLKVVPIFKRERLMRESSYLIVDGIQVTEVKWYQKGIFKIIFFVVGAVVSCLLTACTTLGALLAGSSAAWTALGLYVLQAAAIGIGLNMLLDMIDNPILAALLIIVAGVVLGGGIGKIDFMQMATLAVEATNTYMQKAFAQEMIEMEEKMKELKKTFAKSSEEMDALMEASGMKTSVNKDWIIDKAALPPPGQLPGEFFEKALKRDFAIIKQDNGNSDVLDTRLPNRII